MDTYFGYQNMYSMQPGSGIAEGHANHCQNMRNIPSERIWRNLLPGGPLQEASQTVPQATEWILKAADEVILRRRNKRSTIISIAIIEEINSFKEWRPEVKISFRII